jgi:hypothetical protein
MYPKKFFIWFKNFFKKKKNENNFFKKKKNIVCKDLDYFQYFILQNQFF